MSDYGFEVGKCGVDSGQIMIVDPCYVIKNYAEGAADKAYTEVCEVTLSDKGRGNVLGGFACTTLYGDGVYPVYAELNEFGNIVRLTIDFDPGNEDEDEECQRCGETLGSAEEEYCWRCAEHLEEKEKEDNDEDNDED